MLINCKDLDSKEVLEFFTKTLIPRPIAWVLTENENGSYHLESFTYFNAVSNDPPLIFISIEDNSSKNQTWKNIEERIHFVIHIPSEEFLNEIQKQKSFSIKKNKDKNFELNFLESSLSPLPIIKNIKIAYICQKFQIIEIGEIPHGLILGLVKNIYIEDSCIKHNKKNGVEIDPKKVQPIYSIGESFLGILGKIIEKKN